MSEQPLTSAQPQPYVTLAGEWGWACPYCRSESRYVYGDRATARWLLDRHLKRCRKLQ